MPPADNASAHPVPGELHARTADLAEAEARYHATLDEPAATEGDRIEAAENLDRARALIREVVSAEAHEADAEARLVAAREACGPEWPASLSMNDIEPGADMF
jgi:hypothetical protein